jgi:signal peptidase II
LNPTDPTTPGASSTTAETDRQSAIDSRKSLGERIRAYRLLWAIGIAIFIADQATKWWIVKNIRFDPWHTHKDPEAQIEVIRGFFYIIHVGNPGAAWSMFSGQSVLLAWLAAATLIAIFWWRHALGLRARLSQVCFGLLCGGIVGNLLDRFRHKHVIDFIDLHFGSSYIYPTFNVADSAICVGVILYLWQSLKAPKSSADL